MKVSFNKMSIKFQKTIFYQDIKNGASFVVQKTADSVQNMVCDILSWQDLNKRIEEDQIVIFLTLWPRFQLRGCIVILTNASYNNKSGKSTYM